MAVEDYKVKRDHFDPQGGDFGMAFPCCVCKYRFGTDRDMPCRVCDHNSNADPEPAT